MALLPLTYRRPAYVPKTKRQSETSEKGSIRSGRSALSSGIPEELSFENIIDGKTCQPVGLRDFMSYLLYVELAAENLQFYLWYQDYSRRFAACPDSAARLSPEWTKEMEEEVSMRLQKETTEHLRRGGTVAHALESPHTALNFDEKPILASAEPPASSDSGTPLYEQPSSATLTSFPLEAESAYAPSLLAPSNAATHRSQAGDAFASAGVMAPFTIQPFREEMDRIISTYIMASAPRQLNLSDRDRKTILHALAYTTHPSAIRLAFVSVESSLRRQSHPNFIRWSTFNGNPPRINAVFILGVVSLFLCLIAATLITLSGRPHSWRAIAAGLTVVAVATIAASRRGVCLCMYTAGQHRHIRPWELFLDTEPGDDSRKKSFDSFGSANRFEEEPWVARYESRSLLSKIFDREMMISDPTIRSIQHIIALQSFAAGLVGGGLVMIVFYWIPSGNFY